MSQLLTVNIVDDCPPRARGVISGLLQQGYATGYLIAVVFTRAIADTQSHTWRAMYWVEAGITFIIAISRTILPQTNLTRERILESKLQQLNGVATEPFNLVYSWSHYTGSIGSLNAAAFFLQFFAQGCFAIVPLFLNSLADPELKSFIVGMSYQLGNLASSASSTIESTIGARFPLNINVLLFGPERKTIEQDIQEEKELNDFYDNKFSETNDVQQIEQSEKNEVTVNDSTKKN
ncbi:hypothetical protein QCA50_019218 [Cerrena zonata]|uniref:Major facilitator superfamily (MFS) profile domain-containing protein n=1 Tax=Cerrena zonata TaxID=2478898 RepID=A0AAW0FBB9_9APHY